jgi:hypothetical protein
MANQMPVRYASVIVQDSATGVSLSGALTGEDGRFVVQGLAPGQYQVRVTFPGFYEAEADVLVSPLNTTYDLGDIRLPRLENYKEDVTVTADGIRLAGLDTQVFKLGEGPAQSTGTILDALKNVPGVTVDQEGKVSLRGSDRVALLIDGRQSSLTGFGSQRGLDSVAAANIEAIEIMNNVCPLRCGGHGRHHQHHLQAGAAAWLVRRHRPRAGRRPVHQAAPRPADRPRELLEQREGAPQREPELPDAAGAHLHSG